MTEWFKVLVLKTSVGQLTASSNLALSAKQKDVRTDVFLLGTHGTLNVGSPAPKAASGAGYETADDEVDDRICHDRNDKPYDRI